MVILGQGKSFQAYENRSFVIPPSREWRSGYGWAVDWPPGGHQVHFITYRQPVRLLNLPRMSTTMRCLRQTTPLRICPYDTAMASTLVDVATSAKLDLLHVHTMPSARSHCLHGSGRSSVRRYLHPCGDHPARYRHYPGGEEPEFCSRWQFFINQSDGVTAVSNSLKQETLNTFQIDQRSR